MSLISLRVISSHRILLITSKIESVSHNVVRNATKATPGIAGLGGKVGKVAVVGTGFNINPYLLPVEQNVERLQTHVCGTNLLREGGQDVEIKPDSEYPDWLWKMYLGPEPKYSDLSPDDLLYWKKVRKIYFEEKKREKAKMRF